MAKVLFFHGGGPTAVINAGLAGAIKAFSGKGHELHAARYGIAKVLDGQVIKLPDLDDEALGRLARSPGSAIGSGRDHLEEEDYHRIAGILHERGFDIVISSGGNGTMDTTSTLAKACAPYGIKVVGIPKTMDNDLSLTDHSPGYLSAALYMAASVREVLYDLKGLPIHVVIIEAFGRNAGWITASSALAGTGDNPGPDMILVPERAFDEDSFLSRIEEVYRRRSCALVVASEGLCYSDGRPIVPPVFKTDRSVYFGDVSAHLSQLVTKNLGIKSRSEKPGLLSRASMAHQSPLDRQEAFACGQAAATAAMEGGSGMMSIIRRLSDKPYKSMVDVVPIDNTILRERKLDPSMISDDGFGVTDRFLDYIKPMIDPATLGDYISFT